MSAKQDRQGARTPAQLEQRYNLGQKFSELIGLVNESRDRVDSVESSLRSDITEQYTTLSRNSEEIILSALESYAKTGDLEEVKGTFQSDLQIMAEQIAMNFSSTSERVANVDGDLQTIVEELEKHFEFSVGGLKIKAGENDVKLVLDNGVIYFELNGEVKTALDPDSLKAGNIYVGVDEVAQFGNYGFVPYEGDDADGLDFVRVGG